MSLCLCYIITVTSKVEYPLSPKRRGDLEFNISRLFLVLILLWMLILHPLIFLWRYRVISNTQINEQIRDKEVRLIGADGEMIGVMSAAEAQHLADDAGLDLVKISPKAKPPVCKIIDYGKYRYEQSRKEKEAKKKQKTFEIKEIRMSPNIDTNDLNTKMNAARKFLTKGNKVKVTLRFRGREMAHVQESKHILYDFAEGLSDIAVVEKEPKQEGRMLSLVLAEKK